MKKQIFIINGTGGCGKDTFVKYVFSALNMNPNNISYVDRVKELAAIMGWNGGKTERDRKFLSDLECLTTEYSDLPYLDIQEKIEIFKTSFSSLMFVHIRRPYQIERAKNDFGAKTVLVINDNVQKVTSNIADANVANYAYDIIVNNNGTEDDLRETAKRFAADIVLGEMKKNY